MTTLDERGGDPVPIVAPIEAGAAHYRRRFEAVMNNATVALLITNEQQQCTYMNPAAETLTGYTLPEIQGRPLHDVFHHTRPDGTAFPREECPIDRSLPRFVRERGEESFVHKDGHFYAVAYCASPIHDGDDILGTIVELYDITARKAEEQTIAERSRLLSLNAAIGRALTLAGPLPIILRNCVESLVEHLGVALAGIWLLDTQAGGTLTLRASAVRDIALEDAPGALSSDLGAIQIVAAEQRPYVASAALNDPRFGDRTWMHRAGLVTFAGYPLVVEDRLLGVLAIYSRQPIANATLEALASMTTWVAVGIERKQTEAELSEQTEVVEAINRIGQMLTSELDLEKLLQALTDIATELTGAQFGSFFYNVLDEQGGSYMLYTLSGAPREAFSRFPMPRNTAVFSLTFSGTGIVRLDDVTKDPRYGLSAPHYGMPKGHLPVRSYLAVPVIARSGEVLGGLFFGHGEPGMFTARDERLLGGIATQASIAIDNARLYARAREAVRLRDEFLSIASHELRNPVAAIKGAAQLLGRLGDARPERRQRYIEIIERTANRLATLTEDLLDVSRLQRGVLPLRPQQIDVAALLKSIVLRVHAENSVHHVVLADECDACVTMADPDRLEQIVENLLNNAIKYSPNGGDIIVGLSRQDDGLLLRVEDFGIGLPAGAPDRIFEPFGRAANAVDRNIEGLGLGLYICRQIAEQHGGRLWAASAGNGQGTTMRLWLPIVSASEAAVGHV